MKSVSSKPIYSLIALVLFVGSVVALILAGKADSGLFVVLCLSTIPSLVAAVSAEQASRDIRNGVVQEKAKQGAAEAIQEQQVLTRDGPVATTSVAALQQLLEDIHGMSRETSAKLDQVTDEQHRLAES